MIKLIILIHSYLAEIFFATDVVLLSKNVKGLKYVILSAKSVKIKFFSRTVQENYIHRHNEQ